MSPGTRPFQFSAVEKHCPRSAVCKAHVVHLNKSNSTFQTFYVSFLNTMWYTKLKKNNFQWSNEMEIKVDKGVKAMYYLIYIHN